MFDVAPSELLLIVIAAIVVIGPKDLPRALYKLGQVMGKARGMARHFRSGVDAMIREAELEDLQKQWAKQNEQIMADTRHDAIGESATGYEAEQSGGYLPSPEHGAADAGEADLHHKPEAGITLGELASQEAETAEHGVAADAPTSAPTPAKAPSDPAPAPTSAQTSLPLEDPSVPEGTRPA